MTVIKHTSELNQFEQFASMGEWIDKCTRKTSMTDNRRSRHTSDSEWFGTGSWDTAIDYARNGWNDGTEMVAEFADNFDAIILPGMHRQRMRHNVVGQSCNVGRLLVSDPMCMRKRVDSADSGTGSKIISIAVGVDFNAHIDSSTIQRRGAAVVAMINAFEHTGYRCEVTAVTGAAGDGGYTIGYATTIKQPNQHPDIGKLAFALANSSMLRRLSFSAMETETKRVRTKIGVGDGYGMAIDVLGIGDIYLPSGDVEMFDSDAKVYQWLINVLSDYGVEIDVAAIPA